MKNIANLFLSQNQDFTADLMLIPLQILYHTLYKITDEQTGLAMCLYIYMNYT